MSRWAPASENNTAAYIANVSRRSGIASTATIDAHSEEQITKIVYAMAISENGPTPAPDPAAISAAWNML